jgi:hypothetical protein
MKRTSLLLSLAVLIGLSTSGCMIVASPMLGTIYTEAKYGDTATDASGASKEGKAPPLRWSITLPRTFLA